MSRQQRQKSASGVYHVILRGVNRQRIFEWEEDYDAIIRIIKSVQTHNTDGQESNEPNFYLFAYCMMDNHIHLLMQPNGHELGEIVKRITVAYAMHFNIHYQRVGHLFQDRYKSEPVEDIGYFYELMQYIHNNPVKAGICETPDLYMYSSFKELIGKDADVKLCNFTQEGQTPMCKNPNQLVGLGISGEKIKEYLQTMPQQSKLQKFTQEGLTLLCKKLHLNLQQETAEQADQEVVQTLLELSGASTITEFQRLDKKTMRGSLAIVREAGCSIRRLSRLTGISEGIIRGSKNPLLLLEVQQDNGPQNATTEE